MREAITKLALRGFFKPFIGPPMGYGVQRRWANALSVVNPPARGVDYERIVLDGVDCEVITPRTNPLARRSSFAAAEEGAADVPGRASAPEAFFFRRA